MTNISFDDNELHDAFEYLDTLRQSCETNMMGAGHNVANKFSWDKRKAHKALVLWIKTYAQDDTEDETITLDDRVDAALRLVEHGVL
jgi:hydroxylamine reductase (hybrid-cluster protein)